MEEEKESQKKKNFFSFFSKFLAQKGVGEKKKNGVKRKVLENFLVVRERKEKETFVLFFIGL